MGRLAHDARDAARDAVEELRAWPTRDEEIDPALLWSYVGGADSDPRMKMRFDAAVDGLYARVQTATNPGLYFGLAGHAWVLEHIGDDIAERHQIIIDRVVESSAHVPKVELVSGISGIGMYLLERQHGAGLTLIVDALAARSQRRRSGITWFTPPAQLSDWQRSRAPEGFYNLGVAHGVPGVVAVLATIAKQTGSTIARELAEGGLAWLRTVADDNPQGAFPHWLLPDGEPSDRRRTAWCYGDIGVAVACWRAAADLGSDTTEWRDIARRAALRPIEDCGVVDPNLCHGAAGLAQLFNRCYQATREPLFRDAATRWLQQVLAHRRPGEGIAGFTRYLLDDVGGTHIAGPSFLDGTAGVILTLLAALADEEPGWDRLLLCDLPVAD